MLIIAIKIRERTLVCRNQTNQSEIKLITFPAILIEQKRII